MPLNLTPPLKIREWVRYYAELDEPTSFDKGVMGAIVGGFNLKLMDGTKNMKECAKRRRLVWAWVLLPDEISYHELHSAGLAPQGWNGLYRWMGGTWDKTKQRPEFEAECRAVWDLAYLTYKLIEANPGLTMAELITILADKKVI